MAFFCVKKSKGGDTEKGTKKAGWKGQGKAAGTGQGSEAALPREDPSGRGMLLSFYTTRAFLRQFNPG